MCGVKDDLQASSWHQGKGGNRNWGGEGGVGGGGRSRLGGSGPGGGTLFWRVVRVLCEILP